MKRRPHGDTLPAAFHYGVSGGNDAAVGETAYDASGPAVSPLAMNLSQLIKRAAPGISRRLAEILLDPEQLVIFRQTVGA
jgi:hypothetical protein